MPVVESKRGASSSIRRPTGTAGKNQDLDDPVDLEFEYRGIRRLKSGKRPAFRPSGGWEGQVIP